MLPNPQETADLLTFTEEILNRKLHFIYYKLITCRVGSRNLFPFKMKHFMVKKPGKSLSGKAINNFHTEL